MSTWRNREDLSKDTIETILAEIDGISRLGEYDAEDSVPYPVTGMDVADAVRYILEHNMVEEFARVSVSLWREGIYRNVDDYVIPIPSKLDYGRSTPHIIFRVQKNPENGVYKGTLYHSYEGVHDIVQFTNIVLSSDNKLVDHKPKTISSALVE